MGRRSFRRSERCFVAEGTKALAVAVAAGAPIESVFVDPTAVGPELQGILESCLEGGGRVFDLDSGVLERVADTVHPQPVLAVVADIDITLDELGRRGADLVVVCADVRDPGNMGTLLRAAEAAGVGGVICCDGSVDVYNPKTVRASAGAIFELPLVSGGEVVSVLDALAGWGLTRVGTAVRRGQDYTEMDLRRPTALVLGNEASGLPPAVELSIDEWASIPMAGRAESLNVGIAGALMCFEATRQRRVGTPQGSLS